MPTAPCIYPALPPGPASTEALALSPSPAWEMDDQRLIRRVAAGDPHAFEQLYQRYARRLRGYLQRLLPPQVLPEDVLHDVLLLVWHQAARYDPRKPLVAWLFGIARHKAVDALRASRPRPALPPPAAAEALEDRVVRQERARAVTQAVAALPLTERQVIELTYYHDCTYPEIATRVACPVNTVKARMVRARARLERQLSALGRTQGPAGAALSSGRARKALTV